MKPLLIVCNDCSACSYLITELTNSDLSYCLVTTGSDCLQLLENNDIEVVLIVNTILDISGLDLIRIITRLKVGLKIIFVNMGDDQEIEVHARQLGLVYYTTSLEDNRIVQVVSKINKW